MTLDLASLGAPVTRAEALAAGLVIDCTTAAAFVGFTAQCAVSALVWEEVVGVSMAFPTKTERALAGDRLRRVWMHAKAAVVQARIGQTQVKADLEFQCEPARPTVKLRTLPLVLACRTESTGMHLTIYHKGELR